jgi:hypothetical protein
MENLSHEHLPALAVLMGFLLVFLLVLLWKVWNRQIQRKTARAMKNGNKLFREWRQDTVRQPLQ